MIERASAANPPTQNRLDGVVEDIAYLGDMSIYRVRTPSGRIVKAAQTNRLRDLERTITWEDPVRLSWDPRAVIAIPAPAR